MAKTIIGKVGLTPKQEYNSTAEYKRLDVVTYDGCSYVCLKDCIGIDVNNTGYWQLLANKGDKGDRGEKGDTGATGAKGDKGDKGDTGAQGIQGIQGEKGDKGDTGEQGIPGPQGPQGEKGVTGATGPKPVKGTDYFTEEEKTEFKNAVVEDSKTDIDTHTANKIKEYNDNATEKTNSFNSNAETKTAEFNENVESYEKRVSELETEVEELSQQASWKTTDTADSLHITDSAKYSRNKLDIFGNMEQETREGINLINTLSIEDNTVNGITKKNNKDGSITLIGTATSEVRIVLRSGTLEAGKYTYKCFGNPTNCKTNVYYVGDVIAENIRVFTVNADSTYNYNFIYVIPAETTVNATIRPMLVKGEYTIDTFPQYEQYGAMPSMEFESMPVVATGLQTIKTKRKNLLNLNNVNKVGTSKGLDYEISNGEVKLNGTTTERVDLYVLGYWGNSSKTQYYLPKGTYTFSVISNFASDTSKFQTLAYSGTKALFSCNSIGTRTSTFNENVSLGNLYLSIPADRTFNNEIYKFQIESGDVATDYEPYQEKNFELDLEATELAKIVDANGNVVAQDKAVYREVDGVWKWQWAKDIPKKIFDGNEKWILAKDYGDGRYVFRTEDTINNAENDTSAVSNLLKNNNETGLISAENSFRITNYSGSSKLFVCIKHQGITDVESWKSYLKNNNLIILFKAKETQYEDCTEQQSAVLDKLYKLQLEKGTNNIFIESENGVTAELQLTYMQDRKMLEEAKEKEFNDRLTAVENLLSTTATSAMLLDNLQTDLESEVK